MMTQTTLPMMMAVVASIAVAWTAGAWSTRWDLADRLPPEGEDGGAGLPLVFVVELLAIAVRQGASIPRALALVGARSGPGLGVVLTQVAQRLEQGVDWAAAWGCGQGEPCDDAHGTRRRMRAGPTRSDSDMGLTMLREALEPSWRHGVSPLLRLQAFADQLNADQRARIERQAAALAVKVMLPCGLCFLPSFVLIGIVPVIAAFI